MQLRGQIAAAEIKHSVVRKLLILKAIVAKKLYNKGRTKAAIAQLKLMKKLVRRTVGAGADEIIGTINQLITTIRNE